MVALSCLYSRFIPDLCQIFLFGQDIYFFLTFIIRGGHSVTIAAKGGNAGKAAFSLSRLRLLLYQQRKHGANGTDQPFFRAVILSHLKFYFMARQKGIVKLEGTLGDITFFRSKDGYIAREKGSLTGDRIASDPAFQRTRENGAEFGRAGKAGKMIRSAFRSVLQNASDSGMVGRLTRDLMKVIQADTTSVRGQRNVIDGEAELLQGFDFNEGGKLDTTLFAPFVSTVNRATGELSVSIAPFVPNSMVGYPSGATHFKITAAAASIDFENQEFEQKVTDSAVLPINGMPTAALNLVNSLTAASTHPLFLVLGIEFYQEVNGSSYPLKNGAFNALQIVKVEGV
jgi:hypothetical protein